MIQREIEQAGLPTIGISIVREFTEKVKPPRTVFLDCPFGHPLGRPFHKEQQAAVIISALKQLYAAPGPGTICDLNLKWGSSNYPSISWVSQTRGNLEIRHSEMDTNYPV